MFTIQHFFNAGLVVAILGCAVWAYFQGKQYR